MTKIPIAHLPTFSVSLILYTLAIFFVGKGAFAQKSYGVGLGLITGTQTKPLSIQNERIHFNAPIGGQLSLVSAFYFKKHPIQMRFGFGGKFLKCSGVTESNLSLYTTTYKVNAFLGARYVVNEHWEFGGQWQIENNRDFQEITYLKADLWRFYAQVDVVYKLHVKWETVVSYALSVNNNESVYLMYVPANQFKVGVNFYFNEM